MVLPVLCFSRERIQITVSLTAKGEATYMPKVIVVDVSVRVSG